jgi:hypothetical protein
MSANAPLFSSATTPSTQDPNEYDLRWSSCHAEFEQLVESQIGEYLADRGSDMRAFSDFVAEMDPDSLPEEEGRQASAFAELLVGMVEFRAFCDIMKDSVKRDYYFQILSMYRKSLK